jgi:hypothetical protein
MNSQLVQQQHQLCVTVRITSIALLRCFLVFPQHRRHLQLLQVIGKLQVAAK